MKLRTFIKAVTISPALGLLEVVPSQSQSMPQSSPFDDFKKMADDQGTIRAFQFIDYVLNNLPRMSREPFTGKKPILTPVGRDHINAMASKRIEVICCDILMTPERAVEQLDWILYACHQCGKVVSEVHTENLTYGTVPAKVSMEGSGQHDMEIPVYLPNPMRNKALIIFKDA